MKNRQDWSKYAELTGVGIEIAASMVIPLLLGIWLDNRYDTTPWGVLGGVFLGMAATALKLYKITVITSRRKGGPESRS